MASRKMIVKTVTVPLDAVTEARMKARHELYEVTLAAILVVAIYSGMDHEGALAIVGLRCAAMMYEMLHAAMGA